MRNRGISIVEVLFVVGALSVFFVVILGGLMANPRTGGGRGYAPRRDAIQIRNILMAFNQFASSNDGRFPLPSELDAAGDTVGGSAYKDRTGSIVSLMIFSNLIIPDLCKSPAEVGPVEIMDGYLYEMLDDEGVPLPEAAHVVVDPANAVYDPRFKGTPKDVEEHIPAVAEHDPGVGHLSYAHLAVGGARRSLWSTNDVDATTPVWANRGPLYQQDRTPNRAKDWRPVVDRAEWGVESDSILLFGTDDEWEGNVGFADGHVVFETTPASQDVTFISDTGEAVSDNLFVDEVNERVEGDGPAIDLRANAYLRQWWRGIPPGQPLTDDHLRGGDGPFVYIDGDRVE